MKETEMRASESRLIEETLRQWDDYAAMEDEDRLECVMADVERQRTRKSKAPNSLEAEPSIREPGYTVSSAWDDVDSHQH
jgi:hypothetical protein